MPLIWPQDHKERGFEPRPFLFSMSLVHKYINLKEPYNQGIKEQVTTKNFSKKKTGVTWTNLEQILKKRICFQSKSEKYEHWILNWILHIRNSLCIKFHFEQIILNFWTKFTQERYLCSKTEKVTSSLNSAYSPNFSLNWQFWFFFIRFIQKGFFWSKTEKVNPAYFLHNYST